MSYDKVCVIGLGYVGLPTAALFASGGVTTIGVDVNQAVVDTINSGRIHIVEPGLEELVNQAVKSGALAAQTEPDAAAAFLIAVPTPITADNKPDIAFVEAAARSIAPYLQKGSVVVLESTSPVGTTDHVLGLLRDLRPDLTFPHAESEDADISIAYCPERVLPGNALEEMTKNDRIIGGISPRCAERAEALYKLVVQGECLKTTAKQAELTKLTENAYRDVSIAFANELSLITDELGLDVWEVIRLANHHPRVNILQPGPGVGGHCIAVDPWFIVSSAPEQATLIRTARQINDGKPDWVCDKVRAAITDHAKDAPVIGLLGLAYKPNIDDLRESPACQIAKTLGDEFSTQIRLVESHITDLPAGLAGLTLADLQTVLDEADILVGLVAHDAFKAIDFAALRPDQIFIDVANLG